MAAIPSDPGEMDGLKSQRPGERVRFAKPQR